MAKVKLTKLMLVRKAAAKATLLEQMGASKFIQGGESPKVLNVSPISWHEEAGLSHYGFILNQDFSLKDLEALEKWCKENEPTGAITFHNVDLESADPIKDALAYVGLRINEVAE